MNQVEKDQLECVKAQLRKTGLIFEGDFTIEDCMTDQFIAMIREMRRRKALDENSTFKMNIRREYND